MLPDSEELDNSVGFTSGQRSGLLGFFSSGPLLAKVPSSHSFDEQRGPPSSSSSFPDCAKFTLNFSLTYSVKILFVSEYTSFYTQECPEMDFLYNYL